MSYGIRRVRDARVDLAPVPRRGERCRELTGAELNLPRAIAVVAIFTYSRFRSGATSTREN